MDVASLSLEQIRDRVARRPPTRRLIRLLEEDPRSGVRALAGQVEKHYRKVLAERRRMRRILALERRLWAEGVSRVAGVDEVGVGPLAGPVVAAAVVFEPGVFIAEVDDSKRVDPERREALAEEIRARARGVGIGVAEVEEIDELNVYHAALMAMRRAVLDLDEAPQRVLVDARRIPDLEMPQQAVNSGDRRHFSIAAASIVAKTHRDRLMCRLDRRFPEYGFASHKGYSTPQHQQAIRRLGPSPIHRRYAFVSELAGDCSPEYRELKQRLDEESSPEELAAIRRDFRGTAGLSPQEARRLQQLLSRHARRYPGPEQLSLL